MRKLIRWIRNIRHKKCYTNGVGRWLEKENGKCKTASFSFCRDCPMNARR